MSAYIIGTGMYVPETEIANEDIAPQLGIAPEQIYKSSGIRRRRWASPGTPTSDLAANALRSALEKTAMTGEDIDFVIFGTMTPDRFIPGTAAAMQSKLNLREIPCLDIRATCCNALYGLKLAKALVASGEARHISLCLAEIQSNSLDLSPGASAVSILFGDGAAALLVSSEQRAGSLEIIDVFLATAGQYADDLGIRRPGTEFGAADSEESGEDFYPRMTGQSVIINASRKMVAACKYVLQRNNLSVADISWMVPHQANQNLLMQIGKTLKFPPENIVSVIEDYGNTSSASMGIALDSLWESSRIKTGEYILLPAFGAGFTWGAALCKA